MGTLNKTVGMLGKAAGKLYFALKPHGKGLKTRITNTFPAKPAEVKPGTSTGVMKTRATKKGNSRGAFGKCRGPFDYTKPTAHGVPARI